VIETMGAQVTVLTNPTAGAGRAGRVAAAAVDQLRRRGLPVAVIWGRNALHAAELAQASVERSDAALVVVGGDGMVHLAAQVLSGTSMPLGVVPAGSGNDVARMLGLPQHSAAGAADVIADALVDRRIGSVDVAGVSGWVDSAGRQRAGDGFRRPGQRASRPDAGVVGAVALRRSDRR